MTSDSTSTRAAIDELIRTIYSTSLDPSKWTLVLEQLDELSEPTKRCDQPSLANGADAQNRALMRMRSTLGSRRRARAGRCRAKSVLAEGSPDFRQMLDEHLSLAMKISEKMSTINQQQHLLQQAFDRLSDAIFFLGQNRHVLIANRAAYAMIEDDDGLSLMNGALTAVHRPTADKLGELIAQVERRHPHKVSQFDALAIPKRSGGRPFHVLALAAVTTMEDQFAPFLAGKPSVFLVVSDPDRQAAPPEERLTAIFGLTPAEAKLAAALAGGQSVLDYAKDAGITENTSRWTLKQVQAKTECRRQADLVRLLAATTSMC